MPSLIGDTVLRLQDRRTHSLAFGSTNGQIRHVLIPALLLAAGCEARTRVAKEKALAKIDSLLGNMDVKRKEVDLSVGALREGLAGLRKAKITAQVQLDQINRKVHAVEDRLSPLDDTLKTLRDHLKSGMVVEIAGRSYTPDELKVMAQVIAERKGAVEQLSVLQGSQARLSRSSRRSNYDNRTTSKSSRPSRTGSP